MGIHNCVHKLSLGRSTNDHNFRNNDQNGQQIDILNLIIFAMYCMNYMIFDI